MPRNARDSDATEMRQVFEDSTGIRLPLKKIRQRLKSSNFITIIEPGVGYGELWARKAEVKVEQLFPRGADVSVLKPILDKAFNKAASQLPSRTPVRASFPGAVDANGKPDQGESECRTWVAAYPRGVVRLVVPEKDGLWEVVSTLGELTRGRTV